MQECTDRKTCNGAERPVGTILVPQHTLGTHQRQPVSIHPALPPPPRRLLGAGLGKLPHCSSFMHATTSRHPHAMYAWGGRALAGGRVCAVCRQRLEARPHPGSTTMQLFSHYFCEQPGPCPLACRSSAKKIARCRLDRGGTKTLCPAGDRRSLPAPGWYRRAR